MPREIDVTGFKVRLRKAHRGNLLWEVGGGEEKCSGSPRGDGELGPDCRRECSGSPREDGELGPDCRRECSGSPRGDGELGPDCRREWMASAQFQQEAV